MTRGQNSISPFLEPDALVAYIEREVNTRVMERIVDPLLIAMTRTHVKREFSRGCTCTYCKTKRLATSHVGSLAGTSCAEMVLTTVGGSARETWTERVREGRRERWRSALEKELYRQE